MAFLLLRNSQIEADLVDQLFNSSEKRLARLLIMLAQVGQEAELRTVATPISQEVMAARVGTTRSRINYFMNKFRKLGLIEYNGDLKVHSSLLNALADALPLQPPCPSHGRRRRPVATASRNHSVWGHGAAPSREEARSATHDVIAEA